MKKLLSALLYAALALSLSVSALAQPAAVDVTRQSVRGNATFTRESYDTVWITPVFDDHILTQVNPETYPARFLTFGAPENGCLIKYTYDESSFLNHDALLGYYYFAYDRASFELFLEKAEPEHIVKDGLDGVAIYMQPDSRRAYAMIDLKAQFGGTAKLEIVLIDHSGDVSVEQLQQLIEREVERVQAEMMVEEPGHFWSEGRFASVEIAADRDPWSAVVRVEDLTVTRIEGNKLVTKTADDRSAYSTEIAVDGYSYPHNNEEAEDAVLADGTPYRRYVGEYTGYASFTLSADGKYGPVYLTFKIDGKPDAFDAALEAAYARVSVKGGD